MPYRAQAGGIFQSGLYQNQQRNGGAAEVIDAVSRGASTLIQGAYLRNQAKRQQQMQDEDRKLALEDRTRRIRREDEQDVRAQAEMSARGYVPGHTEETSSVTPGSVVNKGLFDGGAQATAPKVERRSISVPAAFDFKRSQAYQMQQAERENKIGNFSAAALVKKPDLTPQQARILAEASVDFPGMADDFLRDPKRGFDEWKKQYDYEVAHPRHNSSTDEGHTNARLLLDTSNQQIAGFRSDQNSSRQQMSTEFPLGAIDADMPEAKTRYQQLQQQTNALSDSVTKYSNIRSAYAARMRGDKPVGPTSKPVAPAAAPATPPVDMGAVRARAKALYDEAKKKYPTATEQQRRNYVTNFLRKEGVNVQ